MAPKALPFGPPPPLRRLAKAPTGTYAKAARENLQRLRAASLPVETSDAAAAIESRSVPPRGELRTQRRPDAHQLETIGEPRQTDVVGRHPKRGGAKATLALIDRVQALVEWGKIPPPTSLAYDPETALVRVERESAANRE